MENNLLKQNKKFGVYEAALSTLLYIVFNITFIWILRMFPARFRQSGTVFMYLASFLVEALFGVTAYVVAKTKRMNFASAIGANKKVNGDIIFYSILISFACLVFFGNITDSFIEFLTLLGYSSILGSIEISSFGIYLVYVISLCVAPALFEEILFRGAIASGLKEKGFKVALFGSAIIFTLMHGNPEQTIHQFLIGLLIGYIFLKTGNIWIGVIIHFVNNFSAVTMLYIAGVVYGDEVYEASSATPSVTVGSFVVNLIIALIFAAIGYAVIKRLIAKVCFANEVANGKIEEVQLNQENATIKIDDAEVAVNMSVDGEAVNLEESNEEMSQEDNIETAVNEKEDKRVPISAIVMFALAGVYYAFEWLSSLLIGLGIF